MTVRRAVVVDVVRTPFGKGRPTGILAGQHPVDLLALVIEQLLERQGIDGEVVDDVLVGCSMQVGEQAGNVARTAALAAGLPVTVPGVTIDRKCGSFQQALHFAAQGVLAGAYDMAIAGGVESMSTIPMRLNRMGRDDLGPRFHARFPEGLVRQGISAELLAARWGISREAMDEFALTSHQRAATAVQAGRVTPRLVPITGRDGRILLSDEGIRPTSTAAALAALPPAFVDEDMAERFPEIAWSVTAGNSSPITDGAAATLVMSEERATALGLKPLAAVVGFAVVGDDPIQMLSGVIPATRRLLARHRLTVDDIALFEVNEAFASVVLAWASELDVPLDRVNVDGGAIAYGHPIGASGGRLLAGLIDHLDPDQARYGVMTMCESGGMANATLLEAI